MNLNMISKSLLIALPMLALGACSSTEQMEPEIQPAPEPTPVVVESAPVEPVTIMTEEELMVQKYGAAILNNTVYFEFNKSLIKPEFTAALLAHAAYLKDNDNKSITIEGHADEKGTQEYNIALGEHRAKAIAASLESMGVGTEQIKTVSYGEEKPVNTDHDTQAWIENRRAELVF